MITLIALLYCLPMPRAFRWAVRLTMLPTMGYDDDLSLEDYALAGLCGLGAAIGWPLIPIVLGLAALAKRCAR